MLAAAQFVMVLDTTVMNVAISDVVEDLDTSVGNVQLAITAYTLVMAALMLTGGKLGDLFGRRRIFAIGLAVYGIGSLITALSPDIGWLLFGWSLLEGIGAAMVVPAIAALLAANYSGARRAMAFGIIGGVAAGGAAAGPLIGGAVTSALTWRVVFVGEVVVIVGVIAATKLIRDLPREGARPRLDLAGVGLSALGMVLVVYAVLQSSTWGWVTPKSPPALGGTELTPFGLSPVLFVIAAGLAVLVWFLRWERRQIALGREPIVRPDLLGIPRLRAGLTAMLVQQSIALGILFVIPLYLQTVLGKSAYETGLKLLPLTVVMLVAAFGGPRLATLVAPKRIVQVGLVALAAGSLGLVGGVDVNLDSSAFGISLGVVGLGLGLLASQIGNINLSSVDETRSSEVGGLQGTAQNLGGSIGTALIGAVLLGGLTGAFQGNIADNPAIPPETRAAISAGTTEGLDFIPSEDAAAAARAAGIAPAEVAAITSDYEDAQIVALRLALLAAAAIALLGLLATGDLPTERIPRAGPERAEAAPG